MAKIRKIKFLLERIVELDDGEINLQKKDTFDATPKRIADLGIGDRVYLDATVVAVEFLPDAPTLDTFLPNLPLTPPR